MFYKFSRRAIKFSRSSCLIDSICVSEINYSEEKWRTICSQILNTFSIFIFRLFVGWKINILLTTEYPFINLFYFCFWFIVEKICLPSRCHMDKSALLIQLFNSLTIQSNSHHPIPYNWLIFRQKRTYYPMKLYWLKWYLLVYILAEFPHVLCPYVSSMPWVMVNPTNLLPFVGEYLTTVRIWRYIGCCVCAY